MMSRQELLNQIVVCKRRAKNAESFLAAFKADKAPDINKIRYWESEMQKHLRYAEELEDELGVEPGMSQAA